MADNTLTVALEGEVTLHQFAEMILRFRNLVDLLSREIAPDAEITWLIDELQGGSALATFVGIAKEEDDVIRVVKGYGSVGDALQRRETIPYNEGIAREARALTSVITEDVVSLRFVTAESDSIIYGAFDAVRQPSIAKKVSFGSVKGRVQSLNSRGKLKFTLYDSTFDKAVPCYVQEDNIDLLREIWGKNVIVTGRITREPENGRPVSVREITAIDPVIEAIPGSYKLARGIFQWAEGDEPAEVSVRRLRDVEG